MLPAGKYLSFDKGRTEIVIAVRDGQELRLSTAELDDFLQDLMECRILMLPPLPTTRKR